MDKAQQESYEKYLDLFNVEGWKDWIKTVQTYKDNVISKAPYEVDSEFRAGQVRGAVEVLDMVLTLQVTMEQNAKESDEEEVEGDSEETTLYTVTVDGEEHEVTEEELVNGYSRQADYTRKTQQLAEYRKQIDNAVEQYQTEIAKTQQAREQYVSAVAQAIETNYSHLNEFRNIDWNRLKTEDREEYLIKSHEYTQAQEQIRSLQEAQSKAQQEQQAASQQEMQRVAMQEHQKMASIIPDWADDGKRQAIQKAVAEFAISKGYSQDELNQLVDHRSIIVLMQAKAYEYMQSKQTTARKKKVKKKTKGRENSRCQFNN